MSKRKQNASLALVTGASRGALEALCLSLVTDGTIDTARLEAALAPAPAKASSVMFESVASKAKLTIEVGVGLFDLCSEQVLVDVLLLLSPCEKLQSGSVCKGLLALCRRPALWSSLVLTSAKHYNSTLTHRGERLGNERRLCRLAGINGLSLSFASIRPPVLPLSGMVHLTLESDESSAKHSITWAGGWKLLLNAIPANQLRSLSLSGRLFKKAALDLVCKRFGTELRSLKYENSHERSGDNLLTEALKKLPKLTQLSGGLIGQKELLSFAVNSASSRNKGTKGNSKATSSSSSSASSSASALSSSAATSTSASSSYSVTDTRSLIEVLEGRGTASWYQRSAGVNTNMLTDRLGDLFPELVRIKLTDVVLVPVSVNAPSAPTLIPRLRVVDLTIKDQKGYGALTPSEESFVRTSATSFFARLSRAAPSVQELYITFDGREASAATMHAILQGLVAMPKLRKLVIGNVGYNAATLAAAPPGLETLHLILHGYLGALNPHIHGAIARAFGRKRPGLDCGAIHKSAYSNGGLIKASDWFPETAPIIIAPETAGDREDGTSS